MGGSNKKRKEIAYITTMNKTQRLTIEPYEYCRIDHTITEADFNTTHPNPYRIDYTIRDINRYLRYKKNDLKVEV